MSTLSSSTTVLGTVTALFDFTPSDPLGLGFKKGDVVTVYQCLESGWWEGSVEGTRGWFPSNFTTPLNTPEVYFYFFIYYFDFLYVYILLFIFMKMIYAWIC